jgi:hypothetical protein
LDAEAKGGKAILGAIEDPRLASGNIAGSRLAAGNESRTMCPVLKVQPAICVSLTTSRAMVTGA